MNFNDHNPVSVFDMFKIGIGPSSSHTMGPWRAALDFIRELDLHRLTERIRGIQVELHGSLCKTGKGHGTDIGVQMGLCGEFPDQVDPNLIPQRLSMIKKEKRIHIPLGFSSQQTYLRTYPVNFDPQRDIVFMWMPENSEYLDERGLLHPNTLIFVAHLENGEVFQRGYHSVGGGFIERRDEGDSPHRQEKNFPYPINTPSDIIRYHTEKDLSLDEMVWANELSWKTKGEISDFLKRIEHAMISSIYRGCHTEGVLAGGLRVSRRAPRIYRTILDSLPKEIQTQVPPYDPEVGEAAIAGWVNFIRSTGHRGFHQIVNWVIAFALAVNEENASFGRIVTAPTNGAAGVIPAVLLSHICFSETPVGDWEIERFLLCAGEIGSLFKKGSTISAASGGCQAEIGVSSSMAAAALTMVRGGNLYQILMAAEIAMEHHLGLTCDPIKGLVQVPCIERNTMGAIKAITASQLALVSDPDKNVVQLEDVIATMWNTAKDMNDKYKETSEGGLAATISVNYTEC